MSTMDLCRTALRLCRDGEGFLFTPGGSRTLMTDCFGVLAAEMCGDLETDREWWSRLGADIAARQGEDGHWAEPALKRSDLHGEHNMEYLRWQHSYFALNAMDALGMAPRRPLAFLAPFHDPAAAVEWLRARNFQNFWYGSNEIMWLMAFLAWEQRAGAAWAAPVMDALLDELDALQDARTGYWGTDKGASLLNGMAGAFHVYYFYFWRGRPVRHARTILDSTLSLQHADGLFNPDGGGGACHDLDAVDILVKFSLIEPDHRPADVARALAAARKGLLSTRNADGGFCEQRWQPKRSWKRRAGEALGLDRLLGRRNPVQEPPYRYSGWRLMTCPMTTSNVWAAWFRPLALALIGARYPEKFGGAETWTFRRLPGLGWHDPERIGVSPQRAH